MSTHVADNTNATPPVDAASEDPREQIAIGVLLPNGRLVALEFATRADAEAWAEPEEGEQVVEYNILSECSFNSC